MKLFHSPGSCSVGIRILLEEAGAPYELHPVLLSNSEQRRPEFLAINPKGKVPALRLDDGRVLTEFPAIAVWIARSYPQAGLMPAGIDGEFAALELMDYVVASLHMRGYTFVANPQRFVEIPEAKEQLAAYGRKVYADGVAALSERLGDGAYFLGDFSVADAAAFYLLSWAERAGVTLPANLQAYVERVSARPAVGRALA